jgi:hypothetical protein
MMTRLKKLTIAVVYLLCCLFVVYSTYKSNERPSLNLIKNQENIAPSLSAQHQAAVEKSRLSAVRIISSDYNSPLVSYMSGTYFKTLKGYYVITAQHGIAGPCELTVVLHEDEFYKCLEYVKIDSTNDYLIMQVEEIFNRKPVSIPQDLPNNSQWKSSYSIMSDTVYTGFPNTIGPLTVHGEIGGYQDFGPGLYMLSYAWAGASGAGVFDYDGHYIGHVVAIDVAQDSLGGMNILENVVLIIPSYRVEWKSTYIIKIGNENE